MPRITYIKPHTPARDVPPPDMLREMLNRYQLARGLTAEQLGMKLGGLTANCVRVKKAQGTASWRVSDLIRWCCVLDIPPEEIGRALLNTGIKEIKK